MRRCPRVHLLATSREPLGSGGETLYRVPSLSLPGPGDPGSGTPGSFDAVTLLADRARAHGVALAVDEQACPVVVSVCRRLDGMPLAIELAAARLRSISLAELHDRLDQRFRLLETIRLFTAERLAEAAAVVAAHCAHFLSVAEAAAAYLAGPEQGRWLARLDADQANLRRAAQYAAGRPDGTAVVLRLGVALGRYWETRSPGGPPQIRNRVRVGHHRACKSAGMCASVLADHGLCSSGRSGDPGGPGAAHAASQKGWRTLRVHRHSAARVSVTHPPAACIRRSPRRRKGPRSTARMVAGTSGCSRGIPGAW